jgi:mannose-6-phosphate isomerase-like protein (cupin superfamily)
MEELDKALAIALTGAEADEAVAAMREQVAEWGLALPDSPPFVCDFGLGRFGEIGEIETWIANETVAGYCGKLMFVFDGQTCPLHHHQTKHETFYIMKGRVRMAVGEEVREMGEGDVLPVAPGVRHSFTGIGPALLLEVSMPCVIEDNCFANPEIPIGREATCSSG